METEKLTYETQMKYKTITRSELNRKIKDINKSGVLREKEIILQKMDKHILLYVYNLKSCTTTFVHAGSIRQSYLFLESLVAFNTSK